MSKPIEKQFFAFVIPSMLTMLLNGFYTIVDGFFIGHAVGDVGLAGIGLVWPITSVLMSLGMGIGVGGSVLMSTYRGAGEHQKACRAKANTIMMLLLASVVMTVFLLFTYPVFVRLLGAEGEIYDASIAYIQVITIGGSMQIFGSGLVPIIRNSGKTVQAMLIMCSGLIGNLVFDAVFTMIIPWGLMGAAVATILGQALTVFFSLICLIRQKEERIKKEDFILEKGIVTQMVRIGIAPFGLSFMPSLITVLNNWQCLAYGGDLAVSAYSVANYFIAAVLLLLTGIGEGIQPLISYCSGAKAYQSMKKILNRGLLAVLAFSAVFLLITIPAKEFLPGFFSTSEETAEILRSALPILCISFPMLGLGKLYTSYFYACGESVYSSLLVYADPLLFTPLCIYALPRVWGLNGVWAALPAAQFLVMIVLTVLLVSHKMKCGREEACAVES